MAMQIEVGRAIAERMKAAEADRKRALQDGIRSLVTRYVTAHGTRDGHFSLQRHGTQISGSQTDSKGPGFLLSAINPDNTEISLYLGDFHRGPSLLRFAAQVNGESTDWKDTPPTGMYFAERVNALWPQLQFIPEQPSEFRLWRRGEKKAIDKVADRINGLRDKGFVGIHGYITRVTENGGFAVTDSQDNVVAERVVTLHGRRRKHNTDILTDYSITGKVQSKRIITKADEHSRTLEVSVNEDPASEVVTVPWKSLSRRERRST